MNSQTRKNPIHINEAFTCRKCKKDNPEAKKTCRNHCRFCLYSLHVDDKIPGDRLSECHGLMEPLAIRQSGKKGYQILHRCLKCAKEMVNKAADDDDIDTIITIMQRQNINFTDHDRN